MMKKMLNVIFWWMDYFYVTRMQIKSAFGRKKPEDYRTKGGEPVLIIPGIYENWRFMQPVAKLLHSKGYDVHVLTGLGYNRGTIEKMALVAKKYLKENNLKNISIVAHSKGGLIGKHLLTITQEPKIIRTLIAINTPFSGSKYAYFFLLPSLRIFTPNSPTLALLNKNSEVNKYITSIYAVFDPHIPGGSYLKGARNIQLDTHGHFRVLAGRKVHAAVLHSLRSIAK